MSGLSVCEPGFPALYLRGRRMMIEKVSKKTNTLRNRVEFLRLPWAHFKYFIDRDHKFVTCDLKSYRVYVVIVVGSGLCVGWK